MGKINDANQPSTARTARVVNSEARAQKHRGAAKGEAARAAKAEKHRANVIVDRAMGLLGIDANARTDPAKIRAVLSDMNLDDFIPTYKPMRSFLAKVKSAPQPMRAMLDSVRAGLAQHNPAIIAFLSTAATRGWLTPGPAVQSALQVAYVLEALTVAMANNVSFSAELNAHLMAKRRQFGIDTSSDLSTFSKAWRSTGSIFEAVKLISIDPVVKYIDVIRQNRGATLTKDQFEAVSRRDDLTLIDRFALRPTRPTTPTLAPLKINIAEAAATEFAGAYEDNAVAAEVLNRDADLHLGQTYRRGPVIDAVSARRGSPISSVHAEAAKENGYFPHDSLPDEWARLYESWNAAFVLSQFDDLEVVLPKLFIPSVLNASGDTYLGTRSMALWLTMNTLLFRKLDHKQSTPAPVGRRAMAEAWGRLNKEYALNFAERHLQKTRATVVRDFNRGTVWGTRLIPLANEIGTFVFGE
jgi:hypothetical protein